MQTAPEDYPAGITVVLDVAPELGDGEQGFLWRRMGRQRLLGDGSQHGQLSGRQRSGFVVAASEMAEEQETPGHWGENGQSIKQAVRALELSFLVLATSFESFEELFDHPACPIAVDGKCDRLRRINRKIR